MDAAPDDDDDVEVDAPLGGPLHPDDRLWRHPSELASAGRPARPPAVEVTAGDGRPSAGFGRWLPVVLAGTVGALLTAGLLTVTGGFDRRGVESASATTSSTLDLAVSSRPVGLGVADMAERLRPSLLAVTGTSSDGRTSRGSAVAIRTDHVLTAARVVLEADELQVLVRGVGRKATVVGSDSDTDLAVLAVEGGGLVPASWGEAADLRPGDMAVAVSSSPAAEPGPTVTAGIVSGIARTLDYAGTELRGLLQVDRPVPAEGAGGALLDPAGALVGITLPAGSGAMPFGYAVPAEVAREVAFQLLTRGRVARSWLGVEGADRGLNGGAVVQRVKPSSPAARAGVQEGDIVIEMNGAPTPSMGMLLVALRVHHPGDTVRLLIRRANQSVVVFVTLSDRPSAAV